MRNIFYVSLCLSAMAFAALEKTPKSAMDTGEVRMSEGFFLDGVEGILERTPGTDSWTFRPLQRIEMTKRDFPAGQALPVLQSGVLEQMVQLAGTGPDLHIRLWAMATLYRHENFLYPVFFMPLKEQAAQTPPADTPDAPAIEPDDSILPTEILRQLKAGSLPDLQRFQQVAQVTGDTNLIGRTGYLDAQNGRKFFEPDAFGQNADLRQFILLPSASMEAAEKAMNKTPGRQRYTVSGLVTMYKGRQYLLLRRADRTYTHGNFTQ